MGCSGTSHNMKMATIPPKDTQVAEEVIDNFGYFDEVKYYYNGCRLDTQMGIYIKIGYIGEENLTLG